MLVIMHGLPGSGKSTLAQAIVDDPTYNAIRVNRDDIRTELFGEDYHKSAPISSCEQDVTDMQDDMVMTAFAMGKDVILDNTNLTPKAYRHLEAMAKKNNIKVVHHYVDTPVSVCKERNSQRNRVVPEHIIDSMAKKAIDPKTGKLRR